MATDYRGQSFNLSTLTAETGTKHRTPRAFPHEVMALSCTSFSMIRMARMLHMFLRKLNMITGICWLLYPTSSRRVRHAFGWGHPGTHVSQHVNFFRFILLTHPSKALSEILPLRNLQSGEF